MIHFIYHSQCVDCYLGEDSQKRAGGPDYLNNEDLYILLKKNSDTQSLTDEDKYTLLTHEMHGWLKLKNQ